MASRKGAYDGTYLLEGVVDPGRYVRVKVAASVVWDMNNLMAPAIALLHTQLMQDTLESH